MLGIIVAGGNVGLELVVLVKIHEKVGKNVKRCVDEPVVEIVKVKLGKRVKLGKNVKVGVISGET